MADYLTVQDMLDADITNMTVIRNNSKQDDGVDTVATGINWFYYNGVPVTNVYVSGNSFIGFGANAEHLRVNRRDAAMFYLYKETGTIRDHQFFKLRWRGYSYYNQTADAYLQQYDLVLIDDGCIFLNFFDVPNTTGSGTNSLTCGSQVLNYTVVANVACQYTFTPANATDGTNWSVTAGAPDYSIYCPYGSAIYSLPLTQISAYLTSLIKWTAATPTNTSVLIEAGVGTSLPADWYTCANDAEIPCFTLGTDYTTSRLYIKVTLATTDIHFTPSVSSITVQVSDLSDQNRITLTLGAGNRNNLQKAAGPVTVRYANGDLSGEDALVDNFVESFTPEDVAYKGNQNDREHFAIAGASSAISMTAISYSSGQDDKGAHFSVLSASHAVSLTYVEPI